MPEPHKQYPPVVMGNGNFRGSTGPSLEADELSENELDEVVGGLSKPFHSNSKSAGTQDGTYNTIMFGGKGTFKSSGSSIKDGTSNTIMFGEP